MSFLTPPNKNVASSTLSSPLFSWVPRQQIIQHRWCHFRLVNFPFHSCKNLLSQKKIVSPISTYSTLTALFLHLSTRISITLNRQPKLLRLIHLQRLCCLQLHHSVAFPLIPEYMFCLAPTLTPLLSTSPGFLNLISLQIIMSYANITVPALPITLMLRPIFTSHSFETTSNIASTFAWESIYLNLASVSAVIAKRIEPKIPAPWESPCVRNRLPH